MERVIKNFLFLFMFSKRKKYGVYLTVHDGEVYPYLIENKKYFSLYLYYKRPTGKITLEYTD